MPAPHLDKDTSWFGPLDGPTTLAADMLAGEGTQPAPLDEASGSSGRFPPANRAADKRNRAPTFFRIYRAFLTARTGLAFILVCLLGAAWVVKSRPSIGLMAITAVYFVSTLLWSLWPSQRHPRQGNQRNLSKRQALATIGVDLAAFAGLHFLSDNAFNSQALLALPVLMAAILMPRIMALATAAVATLNLLAVAALQANVPGEMTTLLTQAGLTGFGLFAVAVVASELASRLAREERSARGSMELARQQAQLNKLVIEEMAEGVMVVDRQGRVRTANPAARRLLTPQGQTPPPPFQLRGIPAWFNLVQAVEQAFEHPTQSDQRQEITLRFDDQSQRALNLRVRFTHGRKTQVLEDVCLIFLEDARQVQARQRQDKLAAMGRMSAGIAHEIRNPLAAIAQANALMGEDATTPTQRRLSQMVGDNVNRLKRIIDDILAVAPGARPPAPIIDLVDQLALIVQDWRQTHSLPDGPDSRLRVDIAGLTRPTAKARFEPDHLRRILINLLDNANRHCAGQTGSVELRLRHQTHAGTAGMIVLSVLNDGDMIPPDTERALFEPFFSTRSRGTGLGLYICRELCERHGASIDYRQHPGPDRLHNEFFMVIPAVTETVNT